jgi:hypothetical protein
LNKTSIGAFLIALALIWVKDWLFEIFGMGDPHRKGEEIATLGISASIMILYNIVGWPYLLELTSNKVQFDELRDDTERAWEIVHQVDTVCDYATSIMGTARNLSSSKDPELDEDVKKNKEGSGLNAFMVDQILTLLDDQRKIILQARLREDVNSNDFGNHSFSHFQVIEDP